MTQSHDAQLTAAIEAATDLSRWDDAERSARVVGALSSVARAYADLILGGSLTTNVLEELGRRLVRLEEVCMVDAPRLVAALERVLAVAPASRWAIDRLVLSADSHISWARLFAIYDRAIAAAEGTLAVELRFEAGALARDVAGDPDRALGYLAQLWEHEGAAVEAGRLDSHLDRIRALIDLLDDGPITLTEHAHDGNLSSGLVRSAIEIQLATGQHEAAARGLETMISRGISVADIADLVQRIVHESDRETLMTNLLAHYEAIGKFDDGLHLCRLAIARATSASERVARVRGLVRLQLAQGRASDAVVQSLAQEARTLGDADRLEVAAYRAMLVRSCNTLRSAPTDAAFERAGDDAWAAIQALREHHGRSGHVARAALLSKRGARLPFDRARQRALLDGAASLYLEARDDVRALRLFVELFEDNDSDDVAAKHVDHFVELLERTNQHNRVAKLWERRAEQGEDACLVRAAASWVRAGDDSRALLAYERGAERGLRDAYIGLARLHEQSERWCQARDALTWLLSSTLSHEERATFSSKLAHVHLALGEPDRAIECLEDLLATADAVVAVPLLLEAAEVHRVELHDPAAATRLLERAVAIDPGSYEACRALAALLSKQQRWGAIVELLTPGPTHRDRPHARAELHVYLARALEHLARPHQALGELRAAAKLAPTDRTLHFAVAEHAATLGNNEDAERALRAALLTPDEPRGGPPLAARVTRVTILTKLAKLVTDRGASEQAESLLQTAVDAACEEGEEDTLLRSLRAMRRYELVAEVLRRRATRGGEVSLQIAALRDLAFVWSEHVGRAPHLAKVIRERATELLDILHESGVAPAVWAELASVGALVEDEQLIIDVLKRQLKPASVPSSGDRAVLAYARSRLEGHDPRAAIDALKPLLARPQRVAVYTDACLELSRAHLALDEVVEAFDVLLAGFAVRPTHLELAYLLGLVAIDLSDIDVAERALSVVAAAPARDAVAQGRQRIARAHLTSLSGGVESRTACA